jgi:hypothetical protein
VGECAEGLMFPGSEPLRFEGEENDED